MTAQTQALLALIAVLVLVAGQAGLVSIAPSLAGAKPMAIAEVMPLILWLAGPAAAALLMAPFAIKALPSRTAVGVMVAAGLVMRIMWFGVPAPLEDDYHRYLWDGAVVAAGGNPYAISPARVLDGRELPEAIAALRLPGAQTLAAINFPELTTIYPGVAQGVFAAAHWVRPWSLDGLRVVFLAADLAAMGVLAALLKAMGQSVLVAGLYWLNPLVVFMIFGTGHVDGVLVGLLAGAVLAASSAWSVVAAVLLALAVGVKIWPVILAPLVFAHIWRSGERIWLSVGVFVVVCALALGPVVVAGLSASSGLAAYAGGWSNNNGPFAWASYGLYLLAGDSPAAQAGLRVAMGLMAAGVAVWAALLPVRSIEQMATLSLLVTATLFYLQPAQFPWYALGFLPFSAVTRCWPLLASAVTLPAYFLFFPLWNSGQGAAFTYGVAFVHAVPVWVWLAVQAFPARSRSLKLETVDP